MRRHKQIILGTDIGDDEICYRNLETGVAVVKFQLAAQQSLPVRSRWIGMTRSRKQTNETQCNE